MPAAEQDRWARTTAVVVTLVVMTAAVWYVLAGYERNSGPGRAKSSAAATAAPKAKAPAKGQSPFTGLPTTERGPVLAAKIDNVGPARPATELAAADVVYVEPVESGLSRLLAVYSSKLPARVGPIRSARESDLTLLQQYGRPALAFSGAQSKLLPYIKRSTVQDVSPDRAGSAYSRSDSRPMPHNLYADPRKLLAKAPKASRASDIGFRFGKAPGKGRAAGTTGVRYDDFHLSVEWAKDAEAWRVNMDGKAAEDADGTRLAPKTVVVQYTDIHPSKFKDSGGNRTPFTPTVGSGKALVLRDGRAHDATWSREKADAGTSFRTTDGDPMTFARGQVWVVFAPTPAR